MYKLENPDFLYLLGLIPLFIFFFYLYKRWQKKKIAAFSENKYWLKLAPQISGGKPVVKFILLLLAYTSIVIAVVNPQLGTKLEEVKREGVDLMIALDLSNSMLAEDLFPNRLEKSKMALSKLVDKLKGDRIGIVVFAGQAFVQLPITTDYSAAKLFINSIKPSIMPVQGTAIGAAIDLSMKSFDFETPTSKAIIIISDGENHEDNAAEAAKKAADKGVIIHTLGMGSPKGAPIPVYSGKRQVDYRKDNSGNTVITRLDENMMREISNAGNGKFIRASNSNPGLDYLFTEINKMEKAEIGSKVFSNYEDRFQYFLGFAIFFILLDQLLLNRKNKWLNSESLFGK